MKTILFILLVFSIATDSFGQASIKGKITDHEQNLQFVTVALLRPDSTLVTGVITDSEGEFILDNVTAGKYLVSASMVGYSKFISQLITIGETNLTLPDIILEEETTVLGEVVVKADKVLFEQQIDRLVINVQSSVTSSGNTILEILQKSPGVVVNKQNNTVSMNGKSGVKIMINGKLMQLPLDAVIQMLDGMSSSNVEKIELIATPPAQYDAEGNAGIIHIVTKENKDLGTNGSLGLTIGAHWAETLGGSYNLSHRAKKFAYSLDYSVLRNHNLHTSDLERKLYTTGFVKTVTDHSHRENVTTQQNLSAGFEWTVNENTRLSLLLTGYRRNWDMDAESNDINHADSDSTILTTQNIHESNIWQSATGSVGLQTSINVRSKINFNLDYLYYHNDNPSQYDNYLSYEEANTNATSKIDLQKTTPINFLVGKMDYQYYPSAAFALEAGLKGVTSHLDNNIMVQRLTDNGWSIDPFFTSYSTLNEQIGAAYVSTQWQVGDRWHINSGLRYEYTHTSIRSATQTDVVDRSYGYFFPSLLVSRDMNHDREVQLSYSRRTTRPTYNDIAPYVFFWGPNTFSSGNTSLWPAIADMIKVGYHSRKWILSLNYGHTGNEIVSYQPERDSLSDNLIYRSQNLDFVNTVGLTTSYSFSITSWWEVQSSMTVQDQVVQTTHLGGNSRYHSFELNMNVVNVLNLPKDFSIEISGFYQSRMLAGITEFLPLGSLNAGIQKKFGESGALKFSMDDILYTNKWRITANVPQDGFNAAFNYDYHNQFMRITYTRSLGNGKLKSVKSNSGSEEERGRIVN
jgi:Outer membrane protein beta-barrel family/CarboxypepD_reg-like domain